MATTLRIPPELRARAAAYTAETGIPLNSLIAYALKQFLDREETGSAAGLQAAGAKDAPADGVPPPGMVRLADLPREVRKKLVRDGKVAPDEAG